MVISPGTVCSVVALGVVGFLKNAWNKEPVILASCTIGLLGCVFKPFTVTLFFLNCLSNPVPVRDDGNMPDIPSHPCEPKGNNLEWLKKL
uniref:NADH dehydrogenase [ubiquinone] 1 alpha subcomplex subunit 3 n=1 Tax=Sphaeramia orbicularis TaxID=375764 RepID=A0A673AV82_9TELE